jgi:predicted MFS family arabinose efflux permease
VIIGGSFATVALLFGIAGQYAGGELGHRYKRQVVVIPLALLSMITMVLVGASTGVALLVSASAFVLFNFMAAPSYNALIADFASNRFHGRAYGFTSLAIFGVGSFAGGLGGVIAENHGTEWVFMMMAGVGGIVAALAFVLYLYIRANPEVIAN